MYPKKNDYFLDRNNHELKWESWNFYLLNESKHSIRDQFDSFHGYFDLKRDNFVSQC